MKPCWVDSETRLMLLALALASACYAPKSERLTCDGTYGPEMADFRTIQALVVDEQKGCVYESCHAGATQQEGLRLDSPDLVYEEFSTRTEKIYGVLASGEMPDKGTPWSDEDLKVLRSWYCNGAFPP